MPKYSKKLENRLEALRKMAFDFATQLELLKDLMTSMGPDFQAHLTELRFDDKNGDSPEEIIEGLDYKIEMMSSMEVGLREDVLFAKHTD